MAYVKKLSNGRWQARYRDDERQEHSKNFRTRTAAQRWLDDATVDLKTGDYVDPNAGTDTVGAYAELWLGSTAALKPSTRESYRRLVTVHVIPRWGTVELRAVKTSAVIAWVGDLEGRRSASTTRKALGVLRNVLDLAVRDRKLRVNPAVGVKVSKAPLPEHRFLSAAELTSLADAMPTERDRMMTLLLGWTGLRFGEAIALTRDDIDVLRRRINVSRAVVEVGSALVPGTPKSHAARRITFPTFLADDLAAYMATLDGDLMFPNERGGWIRNTLWRRRVFDVTTERLGLTPPTLRVHDLRHTAASLMIRSGADVKRVQKQLGHRSAVLTLDTYSHLWPDDLDELGDALDRLRARTLADDLRTLPTAAEVIAMPNTV